MTKTYTAFTKAWWLKHGATYQGEMECDEHGPAAAYRAQERMLVEALRGLKDGCATILEVGCGFGRITRVVWECFRPSGYLATDVSEDAIRRAREYIVDPSWMQFAVRDLDAFTPTGKHDLVLAAEVLMHRTPEQVIVDAEQLAELATRYVVNVDWYEPAFKGDSPGCYQHDYAALFGKYGSVERIDVPEARQAIWVTRISGMESVPDQAREDEHGTDS